MFTQAVAAGATVQRPVADQFYGDRTGGVTDPFGVWYIATHKEDVAPEEMKKRAAAADEVETLASLSHPVKSTKGPVSFRGCLQDRANSWLVELPDNDISGLACYPRACVAGPDVTSI